MELDWSKQSPHIRTLFRPWQPGDGYDEAAIVAEEKRLGVRLPHTLRQFYLTWGRRRDLTRTMHPLLSPDELEPRGDVLVFWAENQAVVLWGIRYERLQEADPPVVVAQNDDVGLEWVSNSARLSDFLDEMTYQNALQGGALHGGRSAWRAQEAQQLHWLEDHWRKARVGPKGFGEDINASEWPTIYIREGQAVCWYWDWWRAAAGSVEALDEIAQELQITWEKRW